MDGRERSNNNRYQRRTELAGPHYSVIVPVYNGEDTLIGCLDGLATQIVPSDTYEILIVDDGSTDGTANLVEDWSATHPLVHCRLIRQENAGPSVARNHGAKEAHAPLILFTDADCVPQSDWIERMAAAFEDPQVVGAKGVYISDQDGLVPQFVQAEYEDRYDRMRGAEQIDFVDTYSAAYRRDVFLGNGGFDAVFPTASVEDQELSFRLSERGYRLVFIPDAIVRHTHDESVAEYFRRKYYIGYWKALVMRRHPERIVRDSHTPQVLKLQLVLAAGLPFLMVASLLALVIPPLRFSWKLLALGVAALIVSAAPFLFKLARKSLPLAAAGSGLVFVRALALGGGTVAGMNRFSGFGPTKHETSSES